MPMSGLENELEKMAPVMAPKAKNGALVASIDYLCVYLTGTHNDGVAAAAKVRGDIGLLITPLIPTYIKHAAKYPVIAIDNGVFSKSVAFDEDNFMALVNEVAGRPELARKVRFVVAPDVVGDAAATLAKFDRWADWIHSLGLPVAFAAQDGLEYLAGEIPWDKIDVLFIGGSTDWKLGNVKDLAKWIRLFKEAHRRAIPVHVGRVNSWKRTEMSQYGLGATTIDGTFLAFGPSINQPRLEKWLDVINGRDQLAPNSVEVAA